MAPLATATPMAPPAWRRRTVLGQLLALGAGTLPFAARAQGSYPDRPVHMVIPFTPGGGTDVVGRVLAQAMTPALGQTIVVENKAGAAGAIGGKAVSSAAPDGYTLLFTSLGPLTIIPNLPGATLGFDPLKDLAPIELVARQPVLIVVNKRLGVQNMDQLLALARQRQVSYGSPGNGTELHLIGETLRQVTGGQFLHVPYRGGGPAITDLVGGVIDMLVVVTSSIMPFIKSGDAIPLATTDPARVATLPDVPTTAEVGLKAVAGTAQWGLLGPAGLPAGVVDTVSKAAVKAMADPVFQQRMKDSGVVVTPKSAPGFTETLKADSVMWRGVITRGGIKAN